jgi:competence protein ComEC
MKEKLLMRAPLVLLLFSLATIGYVHAYWSEGAVLKVHFLNIGQGDAVFIEAPGGNQMLIDGGPNRKVLEELGSVMPFYDRSIDVVIATHPDKDHVGGLPEVFGNYEISHVLIPGVQSDTEFNKEFLRRVEREGLEPTVARRGMRVKLSKDVYLIILFPDRDVTHEETNSASIVAKLVYGRTSFLLTGDAPMKVENHLVELNANNLQGDVLKAGHHGSRTSSGERFIAAVRPMYAVISAGKDNQYGHPHKEVVERLTAASSTILGTYEKGRITMTSDGREIVRIVTEK